MQIDLVHDYADFGLRIVPLGVRSKQPRPGFTRWQKRATADTRTIRRWAKWDGNVGIATGRGVFCLDVDPRHDGDKSLKRLVGDRAFPETAEAATGGGGRHFLFRYDPGLNVGNRSGFLPGLDVKGDRGYFVAEPSIHPETGRPYVWTRRPRLGIANSPAWLLEAIVKPTKTARPAKVRPEPDLGPPVLDRTGDEWELIRDVVERFPITARGTRNGVMGRVIFSLLGRGYTQELTQAVVMAWVDNYTAKGMIGTGRGECEREMIANIDQTLRSGRLEVATSRTSHRENIANMPMLSPDKSAALSLLLRTNKQPTTTHTREECPEAKVWQFVESLAAYIAYKIESGEDENLIPFTAKFVQEAILDRHGVKVSNRESEEFKRQFFTRPDKPATVFELVIQVSTGKKGVPSLILPTGIRPLIGDQSVILAEAA